METIGFIGLGNMGGGMAGNIQKAGYPMIVYDLAGSGYPSLPGRRRPAGQLPGRRGVPQRNHPHFIAGSS